jgi:hypothetical protein
MPKQRKFQSIEDVEADYQKQSDACQGEQCLTPSNYVRAQNAACASDLCKVDKKTLHDWLETKGEDADTCDQ